MEKQRLIVGALVVVTCAVTGCKLDGLLPETAGPSAQQKLARLATLQDDRQSGASPIGSGRCASGRLPSDCRTASNPFDQPQDAR